jgi:hypothetical protein
VSFGRNDGSLLAHATDGWLLAQAAEGSCWLNETVKENGGENVAATRSSGVVAVERLLFDSSHKCVMRD